MDVKTLLEPMSDKYESYLKDESRFGGKADEIAFPQTEEELQALMAAAAAENRAVTLQGGRTGIVGAAVPADGGQIINLSRMRAITALAVDEAGVFTVTVEPGVQLAELTEALSRKSFDTENWDDASKEALAALKKAPAQFFPPDPTETTATFGGMFSTNAQGLCAFKYGRMGDYVEKLSLILPNGKKWEVARGQYQLDETGVNLPDGGRLEVDTQFTPVTHSLAPQKGMDLIDLLAGSEGMLGAVSSLTVRVAPAPADHWAIMFFFSEIEQALAFSQQAIAAKEEYPAALEAIEMFDRGSLDLVEELKEHMTKLKAIPDIAPKHQASVYVQLVADGEEPMEETLMALLETFCECGGDEDDTWAAAGEDEMVKFKLFRHAVPESANVRVDAARQNNKEVYKAAPDFVVPVDKLDEAVAMYRKGMADNGLNGVLFGHVGIGRLHINLFPQTGEEFEKAWALIDEWAAQVVAMGGCLMDENGIGKVKRELLLRHLPEAQKKAAQAVKAYFDPKGLLNPGNMF